MAGPVEPSGAGPEAAAQRAADRLALALEDVGFDVGRTFPMLSGTVGRDGAPAVVLGQVSGAAAEYLAEVLESATQLDSVSGGRFEAGELG